MADRTSRAGRWAAAVLAMAGLATVFYHLVVDNTPKGEARTVDGYRPWSAETIAAAETLPVQDGGRVKPLQTFAGFTMLALHGARSMKVSDGSKTHVLRPTAWMLDLLFRPAFAMRQPTFRIDNAHVLEAIGVEARGRRDRYSYEDLLGGREKLVQLGQSYSRIESKQRDPLQSQIVDLATNLRLYEGLLHYFTFARAGVVLDGLNDGSGPTEKRADVSALMATAPMIRSQIDASGMQDAAGPIRRLLQQVVELSNHSKFVLFPIPPIDPSETTWLSAGDAIMTVMTGSAADAETLIGDIRQLEVAARAGPGDEAAFRTQLEALHSRLAGRAEPRSDAKHVALESAYYRKNWFLSGLAWFLFGSLAVLGMWTVGESRAGRWFSSAAALATLIGLAFCTTAIVKRCIIMERPPVGNLYDTIIFIGSSVVLFALIVEWLTRRGFALATAPILGTAFILLARRYELGEANDHMDPLVAVLDSNFWLTTHVITITLGYSAGLLAAFLSALHVLLRGLGLDGGDSGLRRSMTRAVYGMICFTLFLSLIGTVLGGIWANDSWGRFWGWDPKENGALLIVLWTLAILHARLGGHIGEWGLHLASIFTAIVITFSWWHVNFLGVGLHSYGFTAGKNTIWSFYAALSAILAFGFVVRAVESAKGRRNPRPVATPATEA